MANQWNVSDSRRKMPHNHNHQSKDYSRAFIIGVALNVAFIVIEAVFGLLADSLALLADAGHNMSDVLGLLLAWGASYMVRRRATERRTYGWRKSSILAALLNAFILLFAIGGIAWEAIRRLGNPDPVTGQAIIIVAAIGVIVNTATALLFMRGRKSDLNIKGAFMHMAADAGVSAGVVVGGAVILATGWFWIDPVVSLLITVVILVSTWGLLRDSFDLAMDAVPRGIDPNAVMAYLSGLPGVIGVHDLHIWAMSTTETALTAHLIKPNPENNDFLIDKARRELHDRFGIEHTTLQWEHCSETNVCGGFCELYSDRDK